MGAPGHSLKHRIVVFRGREDDLKHVPVLIDFAIFIESKNVDTRIFVIACSHLMTVKNDMMSFGDRPLERHAFAGVLGRHALEVLNKWLFAIGDFRVVLNVLGADVLVDRFPRFALVEHLLIERLRILLVRCSICSYSAVSPKSVRSSPDGENNEDRPHDAPLYSLVSYF